MAQSEYNDRKAISPSTIVAKCIDGFGACPRCPLYIGCVQADKTDRNIINPVIAKEYSRMRICMWQSCPNMYYT